MNYLKIHFTDYFKQCLKCNDDEVWWSTDIEVDSAFMETEVLAELIEGICKDYFLPEQIEHGWNDYIIIRSKSMFEVNSNHYLIYEALQDIGYNINNIQFTYFLN